MSFPYLKHFPYDTIRPEQKTAIDEILNAFLIEGKRYFVLQMGTGGGKSGVAVTVANYLKSLRDEGVNMPLWKAMPEAKSEKERRPGTYIITTQKILQDQYETDFGPPYGEMLNIKSSSNYCCKHLKNCSCAEGLRVLRHAEKSGVHMKCKHDCTYKHAKQAFMNGPLGITNFPYFLTETTYSGQLHQRELLVIDECHNIEKNLSSFIEVTFSEHFAKQTLCINMPDIKTAYQAMTWIKNDYMIHLVAHVEKTRVLIEKLTSHEMLPKELQDVAKQFEKMDKHMCKINRFLNSYDRDNWVLNIIEPNGKSLRMLEFKPIDVAPFIEDHLFAKGERILMMSATILNKAAFCESIGLSQDQVCFLSIPSPFPKNNRPIFEFPVGSLAMKSIDYTLPNLVKQVHDLLKMHQKEKGIIHCQSFKIANYIKRNIRSSRLLIHDSFNREEVYNRHIKSKKPTVLLSPSMTEGIDLEGDRSRFQIICKVPYPYLGCKLTRKRMKLRNHWYAYETAKTIVQAIGRSIRSKNDYAVTYILDSDWQRFYQRNKNLFPIDFHELIQ